MRRLFCFLRMSTKLKNNGAIFFDTAFSTFTAPMMLYYRNRT